MTTPLNIGLGSVLLMSVGALHVLTALVLLRDPVQKTRNAHEYMQALIKNPSMRLALHRLRALTGFCGLGAVPAVLLFLHAEENQWVMWTSLIAAVGFASMVIGHSRALFLLPVLVKEYVAADEAAKVPLARSLSLVLLDPRNWMEMGGVGVWVAVVSIAAMSSVQFPLALTIVGILLCIMYWVNVMGWVFQKYALVTTSAAAGILLLAPIWFVWTGLLIS